MDRASCFLDLFCMRKSEVDIEVLKKIITNRNPEQYGIWERLILHKYGDRMSNTITNRIRYAVERKSDPYLDIVFIFFACMGFEPACQLIITKQLERERKSDDYTFFTQEFVKFARNSITILLRTPFTQEDTYHIVNTCVTVLQMTWIAKTTYFLTISTRFELDARDRETKRRIEETKKIVVPKERISKRDQAAKPIGLTSI